MTCILITGATGVIGSELVPFFLREEQCAVRLLMRADSPAHLRDRVEELCSDWQLPLENLSITTRLKALSGDVCRPRLGLDEAAYDHLADEVTHVVHCAGNVKLNQSLEEARANAVDSAKHVVEFAKTCQRRGGFEKLDAVSTIGVAGKMPGLIPERPLTERREFHNTYEAAKAEAEAYLWREFEAGLPLTIHRPSMVVGHSQTGRIRHFQVFYYLCEFLSGKKTGGFVLDTGEAKLDIVPVDYVARAIHIASQQPETTGEVLHLCSGPEHAIRLSDLAQSARAMAARHGESLPRSRQIPLPWFQRLLPLATFMTKGKTRRALRNLPYFLAYLEEAQSFGVSSTAAYFSPFGLEINDAGSYVKSVLEYYQGERNCPPESERSAPHSSEPLVSFGETMGTGE